jgi:hypothetical protein
VTIPDLTERLESMTEQLSRLREAIRNSHDIQEAGVVIGSLASELNFKYERFDWFRPRHEQRRKRIEHEYKVSLPESAEYSDQFRVTFAEPLPAREFCNAMGWERAYGRSTDVHQTSWHICVPESDLADRRYLPERDPRFKIEGMCLPRVGEWSIKAHLTSYPGGELVGFSGPSGVYKMLDSKVGSIDGYPLFFEQ